MKKYKEHTVVYAKFNLLEDGKIIPDGTRGTIVHVYSDFAYVVEFFIDSKSIIKTVMHDQICDKYDKFEIE